MIVIPLSSSLFAAIVSHRRICLSKKHSAVSSLLRYGSSRVRYFLASAMSGFSSTAGPSDTWLAIYHELRRVAAYYLSAERVGHTLQPTALVHEAFMRLQTSNQLDFSNRTEILAAASVTMRRILIDHARSASSNRKRKTVPVFEMEEASSGVPLEPEILLALDTALNHLASLDPRQASIIEMRFFGGFSTAEIAEALQVSDRTVKREWAFARAWLLRELEGHEP